MNLDLAEILVLVGGSIPPAVPLRRRCQPVLGSLLGTAAGIHRLSHRPVGTSGHMECLGFTTTLNPSLYGGIVCLPFWLPFVPNKNVVLKVLHQHWC